MSQFIKKVHFFNHSIMFFIIKNGRTWMIILNRVKQSPVFTDHAKLNNMSSEFIPFKTFIIIDINLSK